MNESRPQFVELKQSPQEIKARAFVDALIPKHLRKPWRLLDKANKGNSEDHFNAVRELSVATRGLCDGDLRKMAKYMEMNTIVGLARITESNLSLFLPPPPAPKVVEESSIPSQFWSILSKLPVTEDVHECIRYFTSSALQGTHFRQILLKEICL